MENSAYISAKFSKHIRIEYIVNFFISLVLSFDEKFDYNYL